MNDTNNSTPCRPSLTFYHPNAKGTGCAMAMTLHPATEERDGYVELRMANQQSIVGGNDNSYFDWDYSIDTNLTFEDICLMLQVFRGETESIYEGKGIYHRSEDYSSRILLRHIIEPTYGYMFDVIRRDKNSDADSSSHIFLSYPEALGVCEALAGSLYLVAFGRPNVR